MQGINVSANGIRYKLVTIYIHRDWQLEVLELQHLIVLVVALIVVVVATARRDTTREFSELLKTRHVITATNGHAWHDALNVCAAGRPGRLRHEPHNGKVRVAPKHHPE